MRRIVKWLLRGCMGLVVVAALGCAGLYLGGYALDPDIAVSVAATAPAPPDRVHALVSSAAGVQAWWTNVAADMGVAGSMDIAHTGGPAEGPGCVVTFTSGGMVTETWTLREVEPSRVVWDVDFGMFQVERTLTLAAADGGTRVTWAETGRIESPLFRWMGVLMPPSQLESQFTTAIHGLRS